jgi:hypothetical protein
MTALPLLKIDIISPKFNNLLQDNEHSLKYPVLYLLERLLHNDGTPI